MFDLNQCKPGDELVNRDGIFCTYVGRDIEHQTTITYPHAVSDRAGTFCFMDDGRFMSTSPEHKWDIVGFYKEKPVKRVRKPKPVNKLLGLLEWVAQQNHSYMIPTNGCISGRFVVDGREFCYIYTYVKPYQVHIGLTFETTIIVHTLNNFKGAVTKLLK